MILTEEVLMQVITWAQQRVSRSLDVFPKEDPLLITDASLSFRALRGTRLNSMPSNRLKMIGTPFTCKSTRRAGQAK